MSDRLRVPIVLLTISFIVGVVVAREFDIEMWTSLLLFGVCGVLYFYGRWSVLLLSMMLSVGMMRAPALSHSNTQPSGHENHITELALEKVHNMQLSPRAETLICAMVLGDRGTITRKQREAYGYSGASHILAVSGLHLSIIFILLNVLLLPTVLLPRGHIIRNALVVVLIWCYVYVIGFMSSVVRSAVMFSVLQMSWVVGRTYSGINALLFTLFTISFISPESLYSLSFQLSVIAVAAIYMWALPLYYRVFHARGGILSMLCIGVACSVATLPLVSHVFGYFPILGILFSPIFIFTSCILVACGTIWIMLPTTIFDTALRVMVEGAAMLQDGMTEVISSANWGYVTWQASTFQMWMIYAIFVLFTTLIWDRDSDDREM